MTNEDAANVLRIMASGIELKGYTETWLSGFKEAYEMAIKSLEEKPQGEWLRREDVIHLLERWSDGYSYIEIPTDDAIKAIKELEGGAE